MDEIEAIRWHLRRCSGLLSQQVDRLNNALEELQRTSLLLLENSSGTDDRIDAWLQEEGFEVDADGFFQSRPLLDAFRKNAAPVDAVSITWGKHLLTDPIARQHMFCHRNIGPHLKHIHDRLGDVAWIYYQDASNTALQYPYIDQSRAITWDFDWSDYHTFVSVCAENNPRWDIQWTMPTIDYAGEGLILSVSIPVCRDDSFIGLWSIDVPVRYLYRDFISLKVLPEQEQFIVNNQGMLLLHEKLQSSFDQQRGKIFLHNLSDLGGSWGQIALDRVLENGENTLKIKDALGIRWVFCCTKVSGVEWTLFCGLPEASMEEAVAQRLRQAFQQIGNGNFSYRIEFSSSNTSLSTLYKEFNRMSQRLGHAEQQRKQVELLINLRETLMQYALTHSLKELLVKTLDEVEEVTQSPISFYHFVNPDQETLSLQVWSTRTVSEFCTAEGKGLHYTLDLAGVWVDCVRHRKTVIHNDYESLPHKKGMPPGHAPVKREVVVPIFRGDKIVAILGVGNKPRDYTEDDARLIGYCADIAWEMTERKQAAEQLENYRDYLEELVEERTGELTMANDRLQQEILERKKVEQKLRDNAETLRVLVREVNHRVKNNLSAIIGMLHMEEDRVKAGEAVQYLPSLQDLICRIDGLATVHSLLSASGWRPLEVDELCRQVVDAALKGVPIGRRMRVKVMSSKIQINSNQAHHLTLIINELATNSMKYGFGIRDEATINIAFHQDKRSLMIVFRDDGPGYPEEILRDNCKLSSIGFELIRGIAFRSLNGTVEFTNDNGALSRIVFNNELN